MTITIKPGKANWFFRPQVTMSNYLASPVFPFLQWASSRPPAIGEPLTFINNRRRPGFTPRSTKGCVMKSLRRCPAGFTLVEIMIVVAIIGLLASIAIPNFVNVRRKAQATACMNNLRQIDAAKQQWALDKGRSSADTPAPADLQPYLGRSEHGSLSSVYCPLAGKGDLNGYTIGAVGVAPRCNSYHPQEHPSQIE
jgi:prepilin-type N-terminal cleavage/methylation domain-containing protein